MKKLVAGCLFLTLCAASCGQGKGTKGAFEALTQMVDSMKAPSDDDVSLPPTEETDKPLEADELFDDFIFNYASDPVLQRQRTTFPLPYDKDGQLTRIDKGAWKHDRLFTEESVYTLLFDREQDMDIVGDTSLTSVQVEWLFLHEARMRKYYFQRTRGMWMLDSIAQQRLAMNAPDDFLAFYTRFVSDSIYQSKHIHSPLHFITLDPDDEFSILETTLDREQWYAFRPQMPAKWLTNICYGQRNEARSRTKILKVNGIGNGYSNVFYFRIRQGEWELYKFEDTSI